MPKSTFIYLILLFLTSCGLTKVNIEKVKAGNYLDKAKVVSSQVYFNDFYDTGMNSAWDNSWYKFYETTDFIYYGQKNQWNNSRLQSFKKVNKDSLNTYLPGYMLFNPDKFYQIIRDSIITKIDNAPNPCAQSTGKLKHDYLLKDGNIHVRFTYSKTCYKFLPITTQYKMILSGNDLSIISSKVE